MTGFFSPSARSPFGRRPFDPDDPVQFSFKDENPFLFLPYFDLRFFFHVYKISWLIALLIPCMNDHRGSRLGEIGSAFHWAGISQGRQIRGRCTSFVKSHMISKYYRNYETKRNPFLIFETLYSGDSLSANSVIFFFISRI